jgi:uncharacterized protein YdiU (UPF0061 family)
VDGYYPELSAAPDRAAAVLDTVVGRAAVLTARWMAAGFVHGVLNTDNMNITGESFDYGPYRFLPRNDPNFTAAYFDEYGLYSFGRQPEAVFWNLQQLAGTLTLVTGEEPLVEALNSFAGRYADALREAMLARLGLRSRGPEPDVALVNAAFRGLAAGGGELGWEPFFFDWFGGSADRAAAASRGAIYDAAPFEDFRALIGEFVPDRPERLDHPMFAAADPEALLIDEIEALWAAIAERDDWAPFEAKLARIEAARVGWGLSAG